MNEAELHAYGKVAQAIAQRAFDKAEFNDNKFRNGRPELRNARWPIYHHDFTSVYEAAAQDLQRLGILQDCCEGSWLQFTYFVFACDLDQADAVAVRNWRVGPSFDDLLVTFLALFGDLGPAYWGFSVTPGLPFGNESRLAPTLDALASLGYLVKTTRGYVWSEQIRPHMQRAGYWQDDDAAP